MSAYFIYFKSSLHMLCPVGTPSFILGFGGEGLSSFFISPSTMCSEPVLVVIRQPQSMMLPPPCLTVDSFLRFKKTFSPEGICLTNFKQLQTPPSVNVIHQFLIYRRYEM
ncbi:hypothetical protein ILYODFUR_037257 [Ilyodon furcidens]|uniref:Uncharacterized protein n=1 Tax=Ilyodon furcidens TaxID=33524 RepID=A0ABV0T3Q1_9TELE